MTSIPSFRANISTKGKPTTYVMKKGEHRIFLQQNSTLKIKCKYTFGYFSKKGFTVYIQINEKILKGFCLCFSTSCRKIDFWNPFILLCTFNAKIILKKRDLRIFCYIVILPNTYHVFLCEILKIVQKR